MAMVPDTIELMTEVRTYPRFWPNYEPTEKFSASVMGWRVVHSGEASKVRQNFTALENTTCYRITKPQRSLGVARIMVSAMATSRVWKLGSILVSTATF